MSEDIKKENVSYEDMISNFPPDIKIVEVPKKRGRPPKIGGVKKGARGDYFRPVENNILNYIKTEDKIEKDKIFNQYLYQPIYDMVCTIYRRYYDGQEAKYPFEEDAEEIINDTYSFLLTKFDKFTPGMKSKKYSDREVTAYSYYQTIIKNYLRLKTLKFQKKLERTTSYDIVSYELNNDESYTYSIDELPVANQLINATIENINKILNNTSNIKLNKNEMKVGYALVDMLTNWDTLFSHMGSQKFNKSSILFFLQETTFLNDKEIRDSMKKYKNIYLSTKKSIL